MSLQPGDVVADRYELGHQLGAGGMARVYVARDRLLDREVAVKVLSEPYAGNPQFVERFRREASAAAGLNHPNIVAVYDRGEAEGSYYIVMEYLPGPDLKQVIRRDAPLPPDRAVDYALQILAALGAAHRRDVIHRDVKPQNVLLAEDGHLKVTDFGIARAGADSGMTEAGSVIGTAQYLSPEQARGDEVTAASDCYAVGIVLYEMLTGRVPFDAERPVAVAMKQITEAPQPPRELVPSIPSPLEAVVLRSLAKRPSERYRTAEEFSRALLDARAETDGATGATQMLPGLGVPADATAVMPAQEEPTRIVRAEQPTQATRIAPGRGVPPPIDEPPARRRRWPWIVGIAVVLLALVAGAFALMSGDDPRTVAVPNVAGETVSAATAILKREGFEVTTREAQSADVEPGHVIRTSPPAGTNAAEGSTVTLIVSGGPGLVTVPDVLGEDQVAAQAAIVQAGLVPDVVEVADDDAPAGEVVSQDPAGNTQTERGATVTLRVSSGPDEVEVPNLLGLTESQARETLEDAGLVLGSVGTEESDAVAPGRVVGQDPARGTTVRKGDRVNITLATEPAPTTISVPNVVGNYYSDAVAKLQGVGFTVTSDSAPSDQPAGMVIAQTPPAGSEVERGTRIVITVSDGPGTTTTDTPTEPTTPETTPAPPATTTRGPGGPQGGPGGPGGPGGSQGGGGSPDVPAPELP